jgi:hypothetical protein
MWIVYVYDFSIALKSKQLKNDSFDFLLDTFKQCLLTQESDNNTLNDPYIRIVCTYDITLLERFTL